MRTAFAASALMLCASVATAQTPEAPSLRSSLFVLGTSDHGTGAAYAPPNEALKRDAAASAALALDAARPWTRGRFDASVFGLAHDPLSSDDRGFFLAGRLRAVHDFAERWRLSLDDSARLQRRDGVSLSDFQRNEVLLGLERSAGRGLVMGLRISDRRRSVEGNPTLSFDRQWLTATLRGGSVTAWQWRLDAGVQRYSTDPAQGGRFVGGAELARIGRSGSSALRLTWIEPLTDRRRDPRLARMTEPSENGPFALDGARNNRFPAREATPDFGPTPPKELDTTPSPREGLLGPSLVVDPLESDESDWDFGRRKQEAVAFGSRRMGGFWLAGELRAQRERGPDLLSPPSLPGNVKRDRVAVRLLLRRDLGPRLALLAQGGWQHLEDNRPGYSFSRGLASLGLELRP